MPPRRRVTISSSRDRPSKSRSFVGSSSSVMSKRARRMAARATRASWPPESVAMGWSANGAGRPTCPSVVMRRASKSPAETDS